MGKREEELLNEIKDNFNQGKRLTFVGFWGNKNDRPEERVFSNFHKTSFTEEVIVDLKTNSKKDIQFTSSEQYFMYLKALHFKDNEVLKKTIEEGKHPLEYKKLGREVKGYDDKEWDKVRYDCMKQALRLKFSSNPKLKKTLLGTGNAVLVEASPYDKIWGVGIAKTGDYGRANLDWKNPNKWQGLNLLGLALMEVREGLK